MCPRAVLEVVGKYRPSRVEVGQGVFSPVAYSLYRLLRVALLLLLLIIVVVFVTFTVVVTDVFVTCTGLFFLVLLPLNQK